MNIPRPQPSLYDHPRIDELRALLAETYTEEGVEKWLAYADKRYGGGDWTFEYTLSFAGALIDGGYM